MRQSSLRNTVVRFSIFAFDIALLWLLVQLLDMPKILPAAVVFVIANSVHYAIGRGWVGNQSACRERFICFQINSAIGLVITLRDICSRKNAGISAKPLRRGIYSAVVLDIEPDILFHGCFPPNAWPGFHREPVLPSYREIATRLHLVTV